MNLVLYLCMLPFEIDWIHRISALTLSMRCISLPMQHRLLALLAAAVVAAWCPPSLSARPHRDYWPTDGWRHSEPEQHGFDRAALHTARDFVRDFNMGGTRMANGSWALSRHADAFLVVKGGYLIHEEYWGSTTNTTLHDIESGGKSVASILLSYAMHHPELSKNLSLCVPG